MDEADGTGPEQPAGTRHVGPRKPLWIVAAVSTALLTVLLLLAAGSVWQDFTMLYENMGGSLPAPTEAFVTRPAWVHVVIVLTIGPCLLLLVRWLTRGRDSAWLLLPAGLLVSWMVLLGWASYIPMFNVIEKPVIYLYPPQPTRVSVELDLMGPLTRSIPAIDPDTASWVVDADTNGTLTSLDDGRAYRYLFWEGNLPLIPDMQEGFVVSRAQVVPFLESSLARQGLSAQERSDFVAYWEPRMTRSPFVLVHFEGPAYERVAHMKTSPPADTVVRVFMVFRALDRPVAVRAQHVRPAKPRTGFVVVEWGGMELNPQ